MDLQDKCKNCGAERIEGAAFCGNCGKPFEEPKSDSIDQPHGEQQDSSEEPITPVFPAEVPPSGSDDERKYTAWEDRDNRGFFEAIWETWKESVFYPEQFYSKLPFRGGIGSPLLYAIIVGWIGMAVGQIYSIFWSNALTGYFSQFAELEDLMFQTGIQTGLSFVQIIIAPIFVVIGLFIASGIFHLFFLLFGWGKRDFEATFRAVAYAESAMVFMIVPFCGGIVAIVWSIVLTIIGMKHMQKTTGGKAALVYFLPWILCCCLAIGAIFFLAITGAAIFDGLLNNLQNGAY